MTTIPYKIAEHCAKAGLVLLFWLLFLGLGACSKESTPPTLTNHFQGGDVSFDYPSDWKEWEKESFRRIQGMLKTQGGDLLALFKSPDSMAIIQLIKSKNHASFDDFFKEKKEVADQVSKKGMELHGKKFVKYEVTIDKLPNDLKVILANAEDSTGEKAVSYQLLFNGKEYNLNFIYKNQKVFEKYDPLRQKIVQTIKMQQ